MLNNPVNITKFYWYSYCLNNPLKYSDPSGMLREALPNYADLGYIYNPEGAAWLANYYYQSMLDDGGSGGYGGDSPWVNNYLNYSPACSENGGEASISDFDNKVNTSSNGSITIQTGTLYVYNWSRLKDEKVWHIGTFRNTEPIYSTIQVGSPNLITEHISIDQPWWYRAVNIYNNYMAGITVLAKFEGVNKIPILGEIGFVIQGIKSAREIKTNTNAGSIEPYMDFISSIPGAFMGLGGFLGGINYILIDNICGADKYRDGFINGLNLYKETRDPFYIKPWMK
jgi:hypothetical protein